MTYVIQLLQILEKSIKVSPFVDRVESSILAHASVIDSTTLTNSTDNSLETHMSQTEDYKDRTVLKGGCGLGFFLKNVYFYSFEKVFHKRHGGRDRQSLVGS